jgi:hypothetical protein
VNSGFESKLKWTRRETAAIFIPQCKLMQNRPTLTVECKSRIDCTKMSRTIYVLHSALAPNLVVDALRRSIDEEHWTLFSLSGYQGNRPLLGELGENTFRLQKRRYSRRDFVGHFYARFEPEPGGTRIEGHFDVPRLARYFMRILLA